MSYDQSLIALVSSTCKDVAGVGIPTSNAAGVTTTNAAKATGTGSQGGAANLALPTGLSDSFAVVAVAGIIGAML